MIEGGIEHGLFDEGMLLQLALNPLEDLASLVIAGRLLDLVKELPDFAVIGFQKVNRVHAEFPRCPGTMQTPCKSAFFLAKRRVKTGTASLPGGDEASWLVETIVPPPSLFIFGAALCNTITTIVQKPILKKHRPVTVAAWNIVIGALINAGGGLGNASGYNTALYFIAGLMVIALFLTALFTRETTGWFAAYDRALVSRKVCNLQ